MKKTFLKIASMVLVVALVMALSVAFVGCNTGLKVSGSAKNVILLIGDGMGLEHLEAVKAYYGLDSLYMESMTDRYFEQTTASRDSDVTDSAAASTALSCGKKTDIESLAMVDGKKLQNMSEYVAKRKMDMGVVVTEGVTGATPAGFSAHANERDEDNTILQSQIGSDVDLFISYESAVVMTNEQEILDKGFTRFNSVAELNENAYTANKIFATDDEFAGYGEEGASLKDASMFAINYLDQKSDKGFFAMIESSHIDKLSHNNDFDEVAKEIRAFDETIKAVLEWAKQDGETLVIITADHETGGLVYNPGDELKDSLFTSRDHTGVNVGVFVYGLDENDLTDKTVLDNTEICDLMRKYIANYKKR